MQLLSRYYWFIQRPVLQSSLQHLMLNFCETLNKSPTKEEDVIHSNTLIQIQCDSNGENNICNATCDGDGVNGKNTTVKIFTPEHLSIVGAREVPACIQSYNHHILNVSDSKQVILQPLQGRSLQ
ncbi:uncharacterized protein [Montipora capricornis]|uniref:uncharacterized protein isoform X2 n=1 Tax=Montipora capricornis TaxID=246305 RepID=UPI0035F1621C